MSQIAKALLTVGSLTVVAGLVMIAAPGPGFVVIAVGVALLVAGTVLAIVSSTSRSSVSHRAL